MTDKNINLKRIREIEARAKSGYHKQKQQEIKKILSELQKLAN